MVLLDRAILATMVGKTLLAQKYLVDFEASDRVSPGDRAIALTLRASWVENHLGADAALAAGEAAAEALTALGADDLPPSGLTSLGSLRSLVALTRGRAELYRGDLDAAAAALDATLEQGIDYAPWAVNAHATRALIAAWAGELRLAERQAARSLAVTRDAEMPRHPGALHAHLALTWVLLRQGDTDGAAASMAAAESLSMRFGRASGLCATVIQRAHLDLVRDDASAGVERLHAYRNEGHPAPPPLLEAQLLATEARLLLSLGSIEHAVELLGRHRGLQTPAVRSAAVAVALADGDPGGAHKICAEWERADVSPSVELLVWRAVLEELDGDPTVAVATLGEAVRRAEPEGDVQAFAQARPHVAPTLRALAALDPRPFPLLLAGPAGPSTADDGPSGNALLVDPLTERELEVLSYLPTYLPKADMARELIVSLNTLKSHVSHIYLKLGVANRREAVEAAQRLGLLPIALPAPDQDEPRAAAPPARRPKNVPSPSEMPLT